MTGLNRTMVVVGALNWVVVGMRLSRLLANVDAGVESPLNDVLLLVLLAIGGAIHTVAMLRFPRGASSAASSASVL